MVLPAIPPKGGLKTEQDLKPPLGGLGAKKERARDKDFYIIINCDAIKSFRNPFSYKIENMKPMGLTSTPFISYHNIKVKNVDLFEDAWGLNSEFCDVIDLLGQIKAVPGKGLTERLIEQIRKQD